MQLFDDISLFDEGKMNFTDFQLPGTDLRLWEQFFPRQAPARYFREILSNTTWEQRMGKMYEKILPDPRLTAYYGG